MIYDIQYMKMMKKKNGQIQIEVKKNIGFGNKRQVQFK